MNKMLRVSSVFLFVFLLGACGRGSTSDSGQAADTGTAADPAGTQEKAAFTVLVDLKNREGKTTGTAELMESDSGVVVHVKADGLKPGKHGFHFHETGTCEGPDFESAGGHFNPDSKKHGLELANGPHAGDLPNLEVAGDGTVDDEFLARGVTLENGQPNSLLRDGGTALVIHADEDDGESQPSGNSGDRIACGVIQ